MPNGTTVTVLFFGLKFLRVSMRQCRLLLYAMLLNLTTSLTAFTYPNSLRQTGSARYWYDSRATAHVTSCIMRVKVKGRHYTNWDSSFKCCCFLQQSTRHLLNITDFCLFVQRLYNKNRGGPVVMPRHVVIYITNMPQWRNFRDSENDITWQHNTHYIAGNYDIIQQCKRW